MRLKEGNKERDIINAAIEIFAQRGFHNSKIADIAIKAGVASGSVYLYFTNKDDLLFKIFEHPWTRLLEQVRTIPDDKSSEAFNKLDLLIDSLFDLLSSSPALTIVFLREQENLIPLHLSIVNKYYDEFLEIGVTIIKSGVKEGIIHKSTNTIVIKHLLFGGVRFLLEQWAIEPKEFPLEVLRKDVKTFVKKGLKA